MPHPNFVSCIAAPFDTGIDFQLNQHDTMDVKVLNQFDTKSLTSCLVSCKDVSSCFAVKVNDTLLSDSMKHCMLLARSYQCEIFDLQTSGVYVKSVT